MLVGVDRELSTHLAANASVTYRYIDSFLWHPPIGVGPGDYRQTGLFTGTFPEVGSVAVPVFGLTTTQIGREARTRDGYHQRYLAFEANATKRMSSSWMGRVGFASALWNEYFDDPSRSILDPTRTPATSDQFSSFTESGPLIDGGPVVVPGEGSGKTGIYMLAPKYHLVGSGMYQGPFDFNFAANVVVRQGYGEPFFRSRVPAADSLVPAKTVLLVTALDRFRLAPVKLLDVRVEKLFKFDHANFAIDFDVFNLFNNATVLGKQYDARSTAFAQPLEILNPRVARLGARFFF